MTNTADLRAAAEAANNGEWRYAPRDKDTTGESHGPRYRADVTFIHLASPDRILAICEELERKTAALHRIASGDEFSTLDGSLDRNNIRAAARAALASEPVASDEDDEAEQWDQAQHYGND